MGDAALFNPPKPAWYTLYYSLISMVIGSIIIALLIAFSIHKRRIKKMRSTKAIKVFNPLVLCVTIGKYILPQREEDNEVDGGMNDLDGIEHDATNMNSLFGDKFGYDVWPKVQDG